MGRASVLQLVALVIVTACVTFILVAYQEHSYTLPIPRRFRALQEITTSSDLTSEDSACTPRDHIFFLKTHKCGSSTVQNILMRRGLKRGLNFVLPKDANYLGHPEPFDPDKHIDPDLRPPDQGRPLHVFTHHTRLHPDNVRRVMPVDTHWVTVLREPASLFESLYNYYNMAQVLHGYQLPQILSLQPEKMRYLFQNSPRLAGRMGYNQMAFDLGMDPADFSQPSVIRALVESIDSQFDLVMISEHMEASLVLLADLMCWPLTEVTFLRLNSRPAEQHQRLSPRDLQKLRELNNVDAEIYDYFKEQFRLRVLKYGEQRMMDDVERLVHLNQQMQDECVQVTIPPKRDGKSYPVNRYKLKENASSDCKKANCEELRFTNLLRDRQKGRVAALKRLRDFLFKES